MTLARRELSVALAILALAAVLAAAAPGYFSPENLRDLFLANLPVLLIAWLYVGETKGSDLAALDAALEWDVAR